jgi:DNA-binding beta-propeller fold protein YncE
MMLTRSVFLTLAGATLFAQAPVIQPGPVDNGGHRLISGWVTRPAGKQIPLSTLPMTARTSADGKWIFILQAGHRQPSLSVHDAATGAQAATVSLKDAWLGLAVTKDNRIYAGGATTAGVHEFEWRDGQLRLLRTIAVDDRKAFIGDIAIAGEGKLFAAHLSGSAILEIDTTTGKQTRSIATGHLPYRVLPAASGEFLVSSWSGAEVLRHEARSGRILQRIAVGQHPTDLLMHNKRLFVASAHTNSVYTINASGSQWKVAERINVSLTPRQPVGSTPSALAVSPDGKRLFIACSDLNSVAVADISGKATSVLGFIPAGWYPTDVRVLADNRLLVLNGKGLRSWPNKRADAADPRRQFSHVASTQTGTLSIVEPFDSAALAAYTRTVFESTPYKDQLLDAITGIPAGNPIPARLSDASPIKHVIYIVKENRTYDQVFGDLEKGNGDPSLQLFGEKEGPNHRKLAREFVLFDNFYVNGDVSADGHQWSAGAIAPDFTQKLYPNLYGGRSGPFSLYPGRPPINDTERAARPAGGYLWDRAFEKNVSVRNYGWLVKLIPDAKEGEKQWSEAETPALGAVSSHYFRGYDLNYPDRERIKYFLKDLSEYEKSGSFPSLIVMRLGNDHTSGFRAGAWTPSAMFADNDLALGQLVEAVSRSRFWKETAIFVLEDDAQAGPDHVDSHRSIAFVASPYTRRGIVDSTMYNTTSVLRTMELILGLNPMTHFDAGANPMWRAFANAPDLRPFEAEAPRISLNDRNPGGTPLAQRSAGLDIEEEADRIDDQEMNDILYRGILGIPAPAPVRSLFGQ